MMYVCGFMVYNYVYIGNFCLVVIFDLLFCLLKWYYLVVKYVCNIIDVDDKINNVVCENGILIWDFSD